MTRCKCLCRVTRSKRSLANYRIAELLFKQRNYQASANCYRSALQGDGLPRWTKVWSRIELVNHLRHRFRVLARQMDVSMLIIDEITTMLAGAFREQRAFLNSIRLLANDLKLPLVCVGTQEAKQALMTDQQLADRFAASELAPWPDDLALGQLLASFESILPLRHPSNLRGTDVRRRILALTDGITVHICRLIETAAIQARDRQGTH
jgi:hypothetical protein